ncbi:MAG: methyltransferase [Nitrososphaerales archaeon]
MNSTYYKPSDDTFLLAEFVENLRGKSALEIAAGSGYISKILKENFISVVATDIDPSALKEARRKADLVVCCDSASAINAVFDLIVINPPYLPSDEINDLAVDGGKGGIEVTVKMLDDAIRLLKDSGMILLVTSTLADYGALVSHMNDLGLITDTVEKRKLDFEEILLIKAKR